MREKSIGFGSPSLVKKIEVPRKRELPPLKASLIKGVSKKATKIILTIVQCFNFLAKTFFLNIQILPKINNGKKILGL